MFLEELEQRSRRLADAAAAVTRGEAHTLDLNSVGRDAHTIKGTAGVMGYKAVGAGGLVLESAWEAVAAGDAEAGSEIGSALGDVAAAVLDAGHIDPVAGTPELRAALEALRALSPGIDRPPRGFPTPPGSQAASRREMGHRDTPPAATGGELGQPVSRREPHDIPAEYGGVIGAVQDWAREGTLTVNTGRLYRLINRIAATRAEASALAGLAGDPSRAEAVAEMAQGLALATDALQSDVLGLASLPPSTLTGPLPQLVTYLAKKLGKNVDFHVSGDAGLVVDRQVLESIAEPVRQLIVNAIYHGLELPAKRKAERKPATGSISLAVSLDGNMLELVVADDGAGFNWPKIHEAGVELGLIDRDTPVEPEAIEQVLFEPGLTTGAIEGGRGDGLYKLAGSVEDLHGRVQIETWPGDGTRMSLRVPAWQSLQRVLIVWSAGMRWAVPEAAVESTMPIAELGVDPDGGAVEIDWDGRLVPLTSFAAAAGVETAASGEIAIVLSHRVGSAAFTVEEVETSEEVVVTELAPVATGPDHLRGVALLGAGEVALVVDVGKLIERLQLVPVGARSRARVLVVDDSDGGRAVLSGSLSSSGFITSVAGTVAGALDVLAEFPIDALVVDFALPTASGTALVEEIRREDQRMPIVMLSGVASEDDMRRAKSAGVDRFFHKSDFREGVLVTALWELLEA